MVLELTVLHVFDEWEVELGHVVLIHVKKNITDHNDTLLNFLPNAIELTQELLFMSQLNVLGYGLK